MMRERRTEGAFKQAAAVPQALPSRGSTPTGRVQVHARRCGGSGGHSPMKRMLPPLLVVVVVGLIMVEVLVGRLTGRCRNR